MPPRLTAERVLKFHTKSIERRFNVWKLATIMVATSKTKSRKIAPNFACITPFSTQRNKFSSTGEIFI